MGKVNPVSRGVNGFYVEWSALNHYLSSFECQMNGVDFIGFADPRVQKLWKKLKQQEKKEILKQCGVKSENELEAYLG